MFSVRGHRAFRAAEASRRLISTKVAENGRGVSELSLVVKAGSRHEAVPGTAHLLQKFVFKDTQRRSGLRLQREAELLGGSLEAQLGREHLLLTARFLREDLPYFVEALADSIATPLYKIHQFNEEVVPLAQAEASLARESAAYVAVEAAFEAAFRKGLSHPTLVSPETPLTLDEVVKFGETAFQKSNLSLFGRNVAQADLEQFAGRDFAKIGDSSALSTPKAQFHNGEARVKRSGAEQVAVLAFPTTAKPCLEALKYVLVGNNVKWSKSFGLLNSLPVKVEVANRLFTDANLFYVVLRGQSAEQVSAATREAAAAIKSVASGLDEQLAQRAIATAKFASAESEGSLLKAIHPEQDLAKVSAASISAAAKSLVEGKRVLSVVGRTYELPYADELF